MKKILSLFLVLTLALAILPGVAMAADYSKPTESAATNAGVVVTHSGDSTAKYYFETLTPALVKWSCQKLAGETVITLLKDLSLSNPGSNESHFIPIGGEPSDWYDKDAAKNPLVIDLGGNILRYAGISNLFFVTQYGFTVRNGTILYTCEGSGRSVVTGGTSSKVAATADGKAPYAPVVKFDNVKAINQTEGSGSIANSYLLAITFEINNSVFWSNRSTTITMRVGSQTALPDGYKPFTGKANPKIIARNSIIGSGEDYAIFSINPNVLFDFKDCTMVTNSPTRTLYDPTTGGEFNHNGQEIKENEGWSLELPNGETATGLALTYVDRKSANVNFTDVPNSAWYYTYVMDLAKAGLINGMTETTFAPDGNLTYGQVLKLLAAALGEAEPANTGSHWASGYLTLAKSKGWLSYDVKLDQTVTRLQFCQLAAKALGLTAQPAVNPFADTADLAVLSLVKNGIISGMTATTFQPTGLLTRAQIAKIFWSMGF